MSHEISEQKDSVPIMADGHYLEDVYKKHRIVLTGVSIYSHNTKNNDAAAIRKEIQKTTAN